MTDGLGSPDVTSGGSVPTRQRVVDMLSHTLVKSWFPTRTPVDIDQWYEIARRDAECVVDELAHHGLIGIGE
jgi:hypothetical protein